MRTVSIQDVCDEFCAKVGEIQDYINKCKTVFADDKKYLSFSYENAIILLYKAFEIFVLRTMISCLNHNHSHFEKQYGIKLGKHINDDVCEFVITKGTFFDFRGRDGLCKILNEVIGKEHNIAKVFKSNQYKDVLLQLCAIRNYAAHNSAKSKRTAMETFNLERISSAGSCLKKQRRFENIVSQLLLLANDIKNTPLE